MNHVYLQPLIKSLTQQQGHSHKRLISKHHETGFKIEKKEFPT